MKALRYLLIEIAIVGVLSVNAQTHQYVTTQYSGQEHTTYSTVQVNPQIPTATMGYTHSDYMTSGSTLPQSAVTGTSTTYGEGGGPHKSGPRKIEINPGGGGSGEPGDNGEPYDDPIGDAAWPLLLAVAVYGVWCMVYRRKRSL